MAAPVRLVLLVVLLAGCSAGGSAAATGDPRRTEVAVFAASSLVDAFAESGALVEARRPDLAVVVNHAGSQRLAAQILQGAPAAVFASADTGQMRRVTDAGLVAAGPWTFARNRLVMVVEAGNPLDVTALADLASPELTVVLAAPEVPAGRYARQALEAAGVTVSPASLELDVRAVVGRVALGEADAGIAYASDVTGRSDVDGIPIPGPVARYEVAVLAGTGDAERRAAEAFVAHVRSSDGQAVLRRHGFLAVRG